MNRLAALLVCVALVPACDGGKDKATPAKTKADAKTKAPPAKGDAKAGAHGGPHGGPPDAKAGNPHAGMPAGPHGGMAGGPMMGKLHKGPPREITPSGETVASDVDGLSVAAPKEWETATPKSRMRKAQWIIPGPGGDGELVVYHFPGGGGGVDANVGRWKGQFAPPEGKTIDDVTKLTEVPGKDGLNTTLVDVRGTFRAAVVPGADEKHNEADYRMLAAIVQGHGDPYYFKLVGPTPTIDLWKPAVDTMIGSFAKGAAPAAGDAKAPAAAKAPADAKADKKADKKADAKADKKADAKADKKADAKAAK